MFLLGLPRAYERGVAEGVFRMEFSVDVHDEKGLMIGCMPVERTGHVKLYADGGGRIAIWGLDVFNPNGNFGDLTPETHFVETFMDAETFAPLAFALFQSVNMDREPVCNSLVAANWTRRRYSRIW